MYEVDAHNVVPAWVVSDKMEWTARTIRAKVHSKKEQSRKENKKESEDEQKKSFKC